MCPETTLHSYITPFNADSVEWCPHHPFRNILACANYQLQEPPIGTRERIGCILLFSVTAVDLTLLQTINTVGVLDQKWCHNQIHSRSMLGAVNAKNTLEIYSLNPQSLQLELMTCCVLGEDGTLLLSLDWSTGKYSSSEPDLVCSDSRGRVHRFTLKDEKLVKTGTWQAHEFEAWIAAFYYWDTNIFFSGGDDSCFLKFDQRTGPQAILRNRSHEAGVTSMHADAHREYILATGSYDANVRLWDIRQLKNFTHSIKMPGPLWRLKWNPFQYNFLLTACMLGGLHIISTTTEDLNITHSYHQHKSIAYGADWSYMDIDSQGYQIIGTCSFYDNLLLISKTEIK